MTRMRLGRSAERIRSRRAGRALQQGVSGRTPHSTTAGTPHSPTSATVGFRSKPLLLLRLRRVPRRQPDCTRYHAAGFILDILQLLTQLKNCRFVSLESFMYGLASGHIVRPYCSFSIEKSTLWTWKRWWWCQCQIWKSWRRLWFYNIVCAIRAFKQHWLQTKTVIYLWHNVSQWILLCCLQEYKSMTAHWQDIALSCCDPDPVCSHNQWIGVD